MEREIELFGAEYAIKQEYGEEVGNGGQVWDCSILLIKYFENLDDFPMGFWRGKKVLELSAGTGAVSIAASKLGAAHVVATDLPQLRHLIEHNAYVLNSIPASRFTVATLSWGDRSQMEALKRDHGPFDVILLSDVIAKIYQPVYELLIDTLATMADPGHSKIILASELRHPDDPIVFFQQLKRQGSLSFSRIPEEKVDAMYRAPELALFEIRKQ